MKLEYATTKIVVGLALVLFANGLNAQSNSGENLKLTQINVYFSQCQYNANDDGHQFYVQDSEAILATWVAYLEGSGVSARLWFVTYSASGQAAGNAVINLGNVNMITFNQAIQR